jgi:prepilin-type N-terminal cleavage/methylation domain-containing protein
LADSGLPLAQGFTLVELLVVIAIVAILAPLLLPVASTPTALARWNKDHQPHPET